MFERIRSDRKPPRASLAINQRTKNRHVSVLFWRKRHDDETDVPGDEWKRRKNADLELVADGIAKTPMGRIQGLEEPKRIGTKAAAMEQ